MEYFYVDNVDKMNHTNYRPFDVIMDTSTSDVYHVPEKGGKPEFAFKAIFLRKRNDGDYVSNADAKQTVARAPVIGDKPVMRVRFTTHHVDPRPVVWPIKHPYFHTGSTGYMEDGVEKDACIIVAYVESEEQARQQWPEAQDIEVMDEECYTYTFTERFGFGDNSVFLLMGLTERRGRSFNELCSLLEISHPGSVLWLNNQ